MKNLITILILFAFSCSKTEVEKLRKSVVGSYETSVAISGSSVTNSLPNIDFVTITLDLLENGKEKIYIVDADFGKHIQKYGTEYVQSSYIFEGTWKIVGKEVHIFEDGAEIAYIFRIEPNGDLTVIADIFNGKRDDYPKD